MTEKQLRDRLAKDLEKEYSIKPGSAAFKKAWKLAEVNGYVADIPIGEATYEGCWELIRLNMDILFSSDFPTPQPAFSRHKVRMSTMDIVACLQPAEVARAKIYSLKVFAWASHSREVGAWRKQFLPGGVLEAGAANEFIHSPEQGWLEDAEFPAFWQLFSPAVRQQHYQLKQLGGMVSKQASLETPVGIDDVIVRAGSPLDRLCALSDTLVKQVHACWDRGQTAWFVLTGEVPFVSPIKYTATFISGHAYGVPVSRKVLTIQAEPWVDSRSLVRVYRGLQKIILDGKVNSHAKERALSVVQTVNRMTVNGKKPRWEAALVQWRRETAGRGWNYEDKRAFSMAYYRTARKISRLDSSL
jgi:hypothetical protein